MPRTLDQLPLGEWTVPGGELVAVTRRARAHAADWIIVRVDGTRRVAGLPDARVPARYAPLLDQLAQAERVVRCAHPGCGRVLTDPASRRAGLGPEHRKVA